ncbi:hypothetical protein [Rhizobium sp. 768_B6_N1_8]|uniref:hypothetical protein n=1 Tax=unclassified Rhizobium TaxID=2613769 RepID=UPI003F24D3EC
MIDRTTPPSTRNAVPLVAGARWEQTSTNVGDFLGGREPAEEGRRTVIGEEISLDVLNALAGPLCDVLQHGAESF